MFPMDFVFRRAESSGLADTVDLIQCADELGLPRYWIGEHHSPGGEATEPAIIAAVLAAVTERITLGVASTLLQYRSPLILANSFLTIERLVPGRVEFAVVPSGADNLHNHEYMHEQRPCARIMAHKQFARAVRELHSLVNTYRLPPGHALTDVRAEPVGPSTPAFIFTGGAGAARLAAEFGRPLAMSLVHGRRPSPQLARDYIDNFQPSPTCPAPELILLIGGIIARSAQAQRAQHQDWRNVHRNSYPPTVVGTPADVEREVRALAGEYSANAVAFLDCAVSLEQRMDNLQRLYSWSN